MERQIEQNACFICKLQQWQLEMEKENIRNSLELHFKTRLEYYANEPIRFNDLIDNITELKDIINSDENVKIDEIRILDNIHTIWIVIDIDPKQAKERFERYIDVIPHKWRDFVHFMTKFENDEEIVLD